MAHINDGNIVGKKFGKLIGVNRVENSRFGHRRWLALCDCGNNRIVIGAELLSGKYPVVVVQQINLIEKPTVFAVIPYINHGIESKADVITVKMITITITEVGG